METENSFNTNTPILPDAIRKYIRTISLWMKLFAVGFLVLFTTIVITKLVYRLHYGELEWWHIANFALSCMELLLTILIAIPLLKAANRFRRYTEHNAIEDMEAAFRLQKTFWQTVGWITMSLIVLFFLFLIPG